MLKKRSFGENTMKIVEINTYNYGSTGNIMLHIAQSAREHGFEVITSCPMYRSNLEKQVEDQTFIGDRISLYIHSVLGSATGLTGMFSFLSTVSFLRKLHRNPPSIIHLHNLHNGYINLPYLFFYIKRHHIPVVWTFHDCWPFTGQCPYFELSKCEKWKTGCHDCPSYKAYPATNVDRTKTMWKLKKRWFTGVENLTIVAPSQWLADLVKQSYLKDYPVKVIHNGIDLSVFKPTPSDFRARHHISVDKFVLLGVAFSWGRRKGLDVFVELFKRLDPEKYQIVVVGTDDVVDKTLPENIISIHRTQNQRELAEIYTAADLFVNPTREEVLGLVNIEAQACGTPVITFKTGGSPECICDLSGAVVACDDIDALESEIQRICKNRPFSEKDCEEQAMKFDENSRYLEYIDLYQSLL